MMNLINKKKAEEGFTLIELMIVVAIIGILAAIAIPQFAAYRIKAFNAAAQSDVHSARLASEALYADYQSYGTTVAATNTAGVAAGVLLTSNGFVATSTKGQEVPVTLSTKVSLRVKADAGFSAAIGWAKHTEGDAIYAFDTDASAMYFDTKPAWASQTLTAAAPTVPGSTANKDDLTGQGSGGSAGWTAR